MKHPMPSRCRLHSGQPSHWYCDSCQLPLCTSCKPYAEQLPLDVHCPLCGQSMHEQCDEAGEPAPLRACLNNALRPPALTVAAGVALVASFGLTSLPGLLLALPVGTLLLCLMIALACRAGEGHAQEPTLRELLDIDQLEYCLRLLPLGLPFAVLLTFATASASLALATAAWLVVAAVLPAALMTAIVTESPWAAFRPKSMARVVGITRNSYLPVALLSIGAVLTFAATAALTSGAAAAAVQGVLAFVMALLALGTSTWLGMIVRRWRRMLEYPAGVAPIDRPRRPEPAVYEPAQLAADAEVLMHEDRAGAAKRLLGRALTRFPDDPRLNEQFDALVSTTARPREFRNHLERRMHRLIRSGQVAAATELWQRYSPRLDNWVPRVTETRYRLALELDEMGEHQTAFRLLIGLPPEDRKFRHIAEAWMEAARILEEHLGDPKRAAELRQLVEHRFPEQAREWGERWRRSGRSTRPGSRPRAASAHG